MRIIHSDDVFAELVNISYTIALDNEAAAQKFLDACDETFQLLAQNPLIGAKREFHNPLLQDVRIWRVKGYEKYLIFYQHITGQHQNPARRSRRKKLENISGGHFG